MTKKWKIRRSIGFALLILATLALVALLAAEYLDIKRELRQYVHEKTASLFGHGVTIEDLAYLPPATLFLKNIRIDNPGGKGEILSIKKLGLTMDIGALRQKNLFFSSIAVFEPELHLQRDEEGKWNISEKLRDFFRKESTLSYYVQKLSIINGKTSLNRDRRFSTDKINITLRDLGSRPGTKTSLSGSLRQGQRNSVTLQGWGYLKERPQKFSLALSSSGIALSPLRERALRYGIVMDNASAAADLLAEGDSQKISVKTNLTVKGITAPSLLNRRADIHINGRADVNIQEKSLSLREASLSLEDIASLRLSGKVSNVFSSPGYRAEALLERLDLASLNLHPALRLAGTVTSGPILVQGEGKGIPRASGAIELRNGAATLRDAALSGFTADLVFSSGEALKGELTGSMRAVMAKEEGLDIQAPITFTAKAGGNMQKLSFSSTVHTPPLFIPFKNDGLSVGAATLRYEGVIEGMSAKGKTSLSASSLTYGNQTFRDIQGSGGISFDQGGIDAKEVRFSATGLSSSAETVRVSPKRDRSGLTADLRGMKISCPKEKAEADDLSLSLDLSTGEGISGGWRLAAGKVSFRGVTAGPIVSEGQWDKDSFSLSIPSATMAEGTISLAAEGKPAASPFPVKINLRAEGLDLSALTDMAREFSPFPYRISGKMEKGSFQGTVLSMEEAEGVCQAQLKDLSLKKKGAERKVAEGVALAADLKLLGKDMELSLSAHAKSLHPEATGRIKDFALPSRSVDIHVHLPETALTGIREALWDSFPDKLLYAGLKGSVASELRLTYTPQQGISAKGESSLKDITVTGENEEFSIGPVTGILPLAYGKRGKLGAFNLQDFNKEELERLDGLFSWKEPRDGYRAITIGEVSYGFPLLKDLTLMMKQEGTVVAIGNFNGSIFGGTVKGSAAVDLSEGPLYSLEFILKGLSLTTLCDSIPPIRGYISGKIDGMGVIRGYEADISQLIGKADFWTYRQGGEKTRISREFLQRIGGASMKSYIGNRDFDRGVASMYLQKGFIVFDKLEISNRNFIGIRDLFVTVAPLNNRISINHLLWTMAEAADRAKAKQQQ